MALNNAILLSYFFANKQISKVNKEQLIDYYEKAGPDYQAWSKDFNMHFGFYEKGMNPFDRESMLRKMNEVVLKALNIPQEKDHTLIDMGCGLASTLRYASANYPLLNCKGVTLVPWQKNQADFLNKHADRIEVLCENYTQTSIPSDSVDHVIAIESSCYAKGSRKGDLLEEMYRILKPGGTFVIADGFLKNNRPLKGILGRSYRQLCKSWALTELGIIGDVTGELSKLGFADVLAKDISWQVAPSVAHVPYTVFKFLFKQLFSRTRMNKERWDNLKSPLLTMVLGLHQSRFGYYLVSGKKGANSKEQES